MSYDTIEETMWSPLLCICKSNQSTRARFMIGLVAAAAYEKGHARVRGLLLLKPDKSLGCFDDAGMLLCTEGFLP